VVWNMYVLGCGLAATPLRVKNQMYF